MDGQTTFGKIVASPSFSAWSQVYSAGSVFAVISLSKQESHALEQPSLSAVGKELLDTFEQEYFSLEEKDLAGVKQVVLKTKAKIPDSISLSFVTTAIIKNFAYVVLIGKGKVLLKRSEKLGVLLSNSEEASDVFTASGMLENDDILVLETFEFAKQILISVLSDAIDHNSPSEIAETLSPMIHQKEEGGAACVIIHYAKTRKDNETEKPDEEIKESLFTFVSSSFLKFKKQLNTLLHKRELSKQVFLGLAILIVFVLAVSIFLAVKGKSDAKRNQLFKEVQALAQKKYDEGQNLLSLNKNLARDDFLLAEKIIQENLAKFPRGSKQEKQLLELLQKAKDADNATLEAAKISPKEVGKDSSPLFAAILEHNATFATQDEEKVYFLDDNGISVVNKKTKAVKQIIKKDEYKNPIGLGTFFSNIYLIDEGKLRKFISLETGYAKTNYFPKDTNPDLSKAVNLAIDGAVWVLNSDGTIQKFLKGSVESFSVNGLDKQFTNATRIFTTADSNKLYILDTGNSRIVVIGKDGTYKQQYQSDILKKAKDLEISEKGKKGFVLIEGKIYWFDLK